MEVWLISFGVGLLAFLYALAVAFYVSKKPTGTKSMQDIAGAISDGAKAFLFRQYKTLLPVVVILLGLIWYFIGMNTAIAFLVGVFASALAGYIGMVVAVRTNVRVAVAAKDGLKSAFELAFRGGSVTGMSLTGLGLMGLAGLYAFFNKDLTSIIGFGFGASLISMFARVGGGIYTKAADVGADLVGKIEKKIPEDDPRNPAVIADNVGDNVGDCAGMAADVFESFVVTIIAGMLLGAVFNIPWLVELPMIVGAFGVFASLIGTFFVRLSGKNVMGAFYTGLAVVAVLMLGITYWYLTLPESTQYEIFTPLSYLSVVFVGVLVTLFMFVITEYYTDYKYGPVKSISESSKAGAATNLIKGLAVGMRSTAGPVVLVALATAASYYALGVYGVALAAVAMLSLSGIVISIDTYGPITDNAGGIIEMTGAPKKVRAVTDLLDAVGNTTKATTKGFAIAGAALGALALFVAYANEVDLTVINLLDARVSIGLLVGALLPFVFASYLMDAVGKSAYKIVDEVRRQFKTIKGLMSGKSKPDYVRVVDLSTAEALKELVVPGVIAVFTPLVVGLLLGAQALGGLLAGTIASGFLLALFMCTAGASWDNAKKYIETGKFGGKGTETHDAAIVGDTVGDPLKDTAGPALNSLIKVINTISILFAVVVLTYGLHMLG